MQTEEERYKVATHREGTMGLVTPVLIVEDNEATCRASAGGLT